MPMRKKKQLSFPLRSTPHLLGPKTCLCIWASVTVEAPGDMLDGPGGAFWGLLPTWHACNIGALP